MLEFKNILVVADHKTPGVALRRAVHQAQLSTGRVTVIDVIPERPHPLSEGDQLLHGIMFKERERALRRLVGRIKKERVDVTVKVLPGKPFVQIIREVLRNEHDLVLKVAEGAGDRRKELLGNTDTNLVRKCPCPVWIIASPRTRRFARIMAAVDAEPTDTTRAALDEAILQFATDLAAQEDGELHVLHAWSLYGEETLRGPRLSTPEREMVRLLKEAKSRGEANLHEVVRPFIRDDVNTHLHVAKGEPDEVIQRGIAKHRAGLLVIGTIGRTGIPGFFIGNTAEKVLRRIDCSIVALKPDGYVSPIKK